jgi:hypothetical protein
VKDEMMRLAYPQGATMYKGIKNAALFASLKAMKPGDVVTDDKAITLTGDVDRALYDAGEVPDVSVGMTVKAKHFMAELPPGTKLRILSVTTHTGGMLSIETEVAE